MILLNHTWHQLIFGSQRMLFTQTHLNPSHVTMLVQLFDSSVWQTEAITWAMSPLRLLRAWWKRLTKSARNCLLISFHPVMTVDPLPLTLALFLQSTVGNKVCRYLSSVHRRERFAEHALSTPLMGSSKIAQELIWPTRLSHWLVLKLSLLFIFLLIHWKAEL